MTNRVLERQRPGWAVAALALVAAGAGCATTMRPTGFPADHTVNIEFKGGCPVAAAPSARSCADNRPACIAVKNGDKVLFQATSGGQPTGDRFELQLDPLKGGTRHAGAGWTLVLVDFYGEPGTKKEFPYDVLAGTCKPLDPQIIVEW